MQFEIARLISLDKLCYKDITAAGLSRLRGSNVQHAPETARTFVQVETCSDVTQDSAFAQEMEAKVRLFLIHADVLFSPII
jgi:RNA-dependent RNA polymerase